MIFTPQGLSQMDHPFENHISPDLRRMELVSRARRDELNSILNGIDSRYRVVGTRQSRSVTQRTSLGSKVIGMIANVLISAGNRLQSAA